MKRPAEPASVEDVSDETNNSIPVSRSTTSCSTKPTPKRKRTIDDVGRSKTKSATAAVTCYSRDPVSLVEAVHRHDGDWPMTILSGGSDENLAANGVGGYRLRKVFYDAVSPDIPFFLSKDCRTDRPISNETTTFIERDIFMTAADAENSNPSVWIEQRTSKSGKEIIEARQLFFLERVVDGKVYIFKGCGDQILGVDKLPDLHLTARVLPREDWLKYLSKSAKYYGYDRQIDVRYSGMEFKSDKAITYDVSPGLVGLNTPCSGIEVSSKRLSGKSSLDQDLHIFTITLQGMGNLIEDTDQRGDLALKICIG
ncbi:hypothetical protein H2200_010049 [Cladophialophora chaetospira]|uniref:Uncharacterized protein n=1 Tax=Cladophialophora chaetospira TaxID=386627 RepID=A0AA39CEN9_9EURO|nr:hypothetical protein H2200_010049 [Cladophialophora chaetospira]